jgi:hypothetical protein
MNGKFNQKQSWEHQTVFDLDNGWQATVEYCHYGEMVTRLDSPDRKTYWHCSNGIKDLPEFAREWLNGGDWFTTQNLVRPKFNRIY